MQSSLIKILVLVLPAAFALAGNQESDFFIPLVYVDSDTGTGLAFSNFGGHPAVLTLEFFAPDGSIAAGPVTWDKTAGTVGRSLLPGEQRALTLAEVFNLQPDQPRVGWVRVVSDSPDVRIVYQHYSASLDRLDGMNAVDRPARQLYFPRVIVHPPGELDANRQTRIAIVNPSESSVSFVISCHRADGTREGEIHRTLGPWAML